MITLKLAHRPQCSRVICTCFTPPLPKNEINRRKGRISAVLDDFCINQALVVQKLDSAIHQINRYLARGNQLHYQLDKVIYPVDSAFHLLNNWGLVNK